METNERLQKFLRNKKIVRRNLSLTPYQDRQLESAIPISVTSASHHKSASSFINLEPMIAIKEDAKQEEKDDHSYQSPSQAYLHNMQCEDIYSKCDLALNENSNDIYMKVKAHYTQDNWKTKKSQYATEMSFY